MKVIVGDPAPIEGAEVLLDGNSVGFTDATGSLTIPEVATGSHTIEARKEGYSPDSATVSVPETTSVTLTLTRIVYTITVHVEGSGPIVGASVYFDDAYVGLTDSAGSITITEVTEGSHTISASKSGYESASATISVPETTSVTLTLTFIKLWTEVRLSSDKTSYAVGEHAYLTQGLYDEAGNMISGRTVDYTVTLDGVWYAGWGQYSDDPSRDMILSKAGTYAITGNFAGDDTYKPSSKTITITARKTGTSVRISSDKTSYTAGETAHLTLGLYDEYGGSIDHDRIVDYTVTLNGAWYAGWGQYGDDPTRNIILSEAGTYVITGNFPGDDTYEPSSNAITITATKRTYTITVSVQGSGPIVGASVYFDGAYVGSTNTAGSITITEVTAGSHTIRASKSGYHDASKTISVPETTSVTLTLTPIAKIRTEVRISSDKTSYTVGETAHITQGLYDEDGNLISGRTVDYTVTLDGAWYAGWGQYSDDPSRNLILSGAGTYVITGSFAGDGTYEASSKSITVTATTAPPPKYTVRVTTYDTDGAYLGGVRVYLDGVYKGTSTATWESITIYGVPKGWHDFKGTKSDYDDALRHEYVNRDMSISLFLRPTPPPPPPGFLVTVRVTDTITGKPVVGVRVGFGNYPLKFTDSTGTVEYQDVATGLYALYMDKTGYEYFSQTYYISSDRVIDVGLKPIIREPEESVDYHWDGLNWVCEYCGAASASLDAIIYHIKSVHPEKLV